MGKNKKIEAPNLEVGAGKFRHESGDWIYHDIQELDGIDIVCDMTELGDYIKKESVENIRMVHVLEHAPTKLVDDILKMCNKLMVSGGKIHIEVPNIEFHLALLQQGRDEECVVYMFGGQENEYDFHMTGFTPKILYRRLSQAGFIGIDIKPGSSISASAFKK